MELPSAKAMALPHAGASAVVSLALLLMLAMLALQQYWVGSGSWKYVPVASFAEAFKKHKTGLQSAEGLSVPFDKTTSSKDALVNQRFSLSSRQLWAVSAFQEYFCLHVLFLVRRASAGQGCLRRPAWKPVQRWCVTVASCTTPIWHVKPVLLDQDQKLLDRTEACYHQ